jgi:hypothetical protein
MPLSAACNGKDLIVTVTYRNSVSDLLRFNLYTLPRPRGIQLVGVLACVMLGYTALSSVRSVQGPLYARVVAVAVLFLGSLSFVVVVTVLVSFVANIPSLRKAVALDRAITLSNVGVVEESTDGRHETFWPAVRKVCQTRSAALIYFSERCAHVIPRRVFHTAAAAELFYNYAIQRHQGRDAA